MNPIVVDFSGLALNIFLASHDFFVDKKVNFDFLIVIHSFHFGIMIEEIGASHSWGESKKCSKFRIVIGYS